MTGTRSFPRWPLVFIASPAAVAVWSGWVGLGSLCGFGIVHPLPGIADGFRLDTAITLPVGVEAYGAYALGAWLTPGTNPGARRFARWSAIGSLALGMAGQVIYHLLAATHAVRAPWPVVVLVSCLPVLTLGFGAALTHLLRTTASPAGVVPADDQPAADTPAAGSEPAAAVAEASPPAERDRSASAGLPVPRASRRGTRRDTKAAVERQRALHPDRSTKDIARRLGVSERTVRRHTTRPDPQPESVAA
jgi:hypothetical protein